MSTTSAITHNTIVQIIGKVISTLLGLVAFSIMAHYLGLEKFGWYITATTYLQFAGILIDFGITVVTAQMLSEPSFEKSTLFKNLFTFRLITAIICFTIAPMISLLFPYPLEIKIAIFICSLSFFCPTMNQVFVGFLQTRLKMYLMVAGEILGRVVLVTGLLLLVLNHSNFLPFMWAIVLGALAYTSVLWVSVSRMTPVALAFDKNIWIAIIKKMWPITLAVMFNAVYLKSDTVILSFLRPQTEVGIYGAAYRVIEIYAQVAMLIMGLFLPLLAFNWSRGIKEEFKQYYQMSFDLIMIVAWPVLVFTIIFGTQIMTLIAGDQFATSGTPLKILSLAVFGLYLGAIFGHTAIAINRQRQTMWIYLSTAVITLFGYLIFIPRFGLYGAAWMTVFSEVYTGLMLFFLVHRYSQTTLSYKNFGKIIIAGLILSLCLWPIRNFPIFLPIILAPILYLIIIIGLKIVSKETIATIVNLKKTT